MSANIVIFRAIEVSIELDKILIDSNTSDERCARIYEIKDALSRYTRSLEDLHQYHPSSLSCKQLSRFLDVALDRIQHSV